MTVHRESGQAKKATTAEPEQQHDREDGETGQMPEAEGTQPVLQPPHQNRGARKPDVPTGVEPYRKQDSTYPRLAGQAVAGIAHSTPGKKQPPVCKCLVSHCIQVKIG